MAKHLEHTVLETGWQGEMTGACSLNFGKLFSELKLIADNPFLSQGYLQLKCQIFGVGGCTKKVLEWISYVHASC